MIAFLIVFFALWSLIPSVYSLFGLLSFLLTLTIVGVVLVTHCSIKSFGMAPIFVAFITGVAIASVFGIVQFHMQKVHASTTLGIAEHLPEVQGDSIVFDGEKRLLRSYGVFDHPNIFAGWLVIALLVSTLLFSISREPNRTYLLLLQAVFSIALLYTFSRSAWLAVISLGVIDYMIYKTYARWKSVIRKHWVPVAIASIALLAAFGQISGAVGQRIGVFPLFEPNEIELRNISERAAGFLDWKDVMQNNIWFGSGVGQYPIALMDVRPLEQGYWYQPVHNVYALFVAEVGVVGFALLLVIATWAMYTFRVQWKTHKHWFFILLPLLIIGMFDHYLWSTYAGIVLLGFTIGVASSYQPEVH